MVEYFAKYPNPKEGRGSFSILRRVDRKKSERVEIDRVNAINQLYRNGTQDFETCKRQVLSIVKELREKERPRPENVYLDANLDILEKFWQKYYSRRRIDESSRISARCSFRRALAAVGDLDLASASVEKIQQKVDRFSHRKQRRLVKDLNALLKFTGREERLERNPDEPPYVSHLTFEEFEKVASQIDDEAIRIIFYVAFTTGMRLGEIFGAGTYNADGQCVPVFSQINFRGERTQTKTRVKRFAAVDPIGISWVKKWLALDPKVKQAIRSLKFSEITKRACRKVFPHDSEKWCRFHDLRHSYAIHCLSKGVPIDLVALSLGNSVQVCQKYYVGFTLTPYQTQIMKSLLNGEQQKAA